MKFLNPLIFGLLMALLAACEGEDAERIAERERQRAEIVRLEGEIALLEERIENAPPDRSAELAEVKEAHARIKREIGQLEAEIGELETRKRELERELAAYQRDYPLR
jgi:chromosome segregation ATPase